MKRITFALLALIVLPLSADDVHFDYKLSDIAKTARMIFACGRLMGMREVAKETYPQTVPDLDKIWEDAGCQDMLDLMDTLDAATKGEK